ncbi:glycosyltransferase family 2 protein [Thaumasiovibrio sp. DFM-14]|uniref:glycosyltransferase family 2 protein n=1 Tax=Thaumasiovibrio sp. DFM-14 TaxID=3384792 RepID=UPI0039A0CCA3
MLISVIIPHYNSPNSLDSLLSSIPEHELIEIIVVDDASLNKPHKENHTNRNVRFLNNNSKGAGSARNVGIKHSTGKWLLFADADDLFVTETFKELITLEDDGSDIIFFPPTSINTDTGQVGTRHLKYKSLFYNSLDKSSESINKLKLHFLVPWSKLFRTDLIKNSQIKFDDIMYSNDVMFSVKSGIAANKINNIDKTLYVVTQGGDSLTKNRSKEAFDARFETAQRFNDFLCINNKHKYRMPLLNYVIWSKSFGFKCLCTTLYKSIRKPNRLVNLEKIREYSSLSDVFKRIRDLLR